MFNAYEQAPFPHFLEFIADAWIRPFEAMALYWRRGNPDATTIRGTPRQVIAAPPRARVAAPAKKRGRRRKELPPADGKARIGNAKIETPLTRAPGRDYGYLIPAGHEGFRGHRGRRMQWVRMAGTRRKAVRVEAGG